MLTFGKLTLPMAKAGGFSVLRLLPAICEVLQSLSERLVRACPALPSFTREQGADDIPMVEARGFTPHLVKSIEIQAARNKDWIGFYYSIVLQGHLLVWHLPEKLGTSLQELP